MADRPVLAVILAVLLGAAASSPASGQPSRVADLYPIAHWLHFSGPIGKPCSPCTNVVPIDQTVRPWGPTGRGHQDPLLYALRYAGSRENYDCLGTNGCGAQCDYTHPHVGTLIHAATVSAAAGVSWDALTPEEQVDAAFGLGCVAPGGGGPAPQGSSCANPKRYSGTPRLALRCQRFVLGGQCHEWLGWAPPAPLCCPGTPEMGCVESIPPPPPPPPDLMCDGGAPDDACTERERFARTCPEDCEAEPPPPPPTGCAEALDSVHEAVDATRAALEEAAEVCRGVPVSWSRAPGGPGR